MSTPPKPPKGGEPTPGPPPKWRSRDGVALETTAGIATVQTVGANFGPTGLLVGAGVTAGGVVGGWALKHAAPGIASRLGLHKPGTKRPRPAGGRSSNASRMLGSRPGHNRTGGLLGRAARATTGGRRPGSRGPGRGPNNTSRSRRPGTSRTPNNGLASRLRQHTQRTRNRNNNGYGRAPMNSRPGTRRTARHDPKTGTWRTSSRNPLNRRNKTSTSKRPGGGRGRGRRPGTPRTPTTKRPRTPNTPRHAPWSRRKPNNKQRGKKPPNNPFTNGIRNALKRRNKNKNKHGLFSGLLKPRNTRKPTKPRTPQPKPSTPRPKPLNTDKMRNATSGDQPGPRPTRTSGGTPVTDNSRIVRPGQSNGGTSSSAPVTDPRFVGIAEAASAPMHEFHSAMEFRRSLPSAAATAEAIGDFFDKYAETAKSSVWLNPAFADSMKQSKTFQRLMKESIDQQEQMFDNLHAERLERIARGSQEDKAWDVTRNQHYL